MRSGLDVRRIQWTALVIAAAVAGVACGRCLCSPKAVSAPDSLSVTKSVDALVMVLLGGIQTLAGPVVGSAAFTWLHDTVARNTDYWRALMGGIMLVLVLLFPARDCGFCAAAASVGCFQKESAGGRMTALLQVQNISKSFGGVQAVRDVSLTPQAGELLALIGPNWRGQIHHLQHGGRAAARPDRGSVRLPGSNIAGLAPRAIWRQGVGRTFQIAQTLPHSPWWRTCRWPCFRHDRRIFQWWPTRRRAPAQRCAGAARSGGHGRAGRPALQ